jgi:hypothetical protein
LVSNCGYSTRGGISSRSAPEVEVLLVALGLQQYRQILAQHDVDMEALKLAASGEVGDLALLGIPAGPALKIRKYFHHPREARTDPPMPHDSVNLVQPGWCVVTSSNGLSCCQAPSGHKSGSVARGHRFDALEIRRGEGLGSIFAGFCSKRIWGRAGTSNLELLALTDEQGIMTGYASIVLRSSFDGNPQ